MVRWPRVAATALVVGAGATALSLAGPDALVPFVSVAGAATDVGVAFVLDFGGTVGTVVGCVHVPATDNGYDALAAFTAQEHLAAPTYNSAGLLCSIGGTPASGCGQTVAGGYIYWSYWHGTSGSWQYASTGAFATVTTGDVEGWRFQDPGTGEPNDPPPRAAPDYTSICGTAPATGGSGSAGGSTPTGAGSVPGGSGSNGSGGAGSPTAVPAGQGGTAGSTPAGQVAPVGSSGASGSSGSGGSSDASGSSGSGGATGAPGSSGSGGASGSPGTGSGGAAHPGPPSSFPATSSAAPSGRPGATGTTPRSATRTLDAAPAAAHPGGGSSGGGAAPLVVTAAILAALGALAAFRRHRRKTAP